MLCSHGETTASGNHIVTAEQRGGAHIERVRDVVRSAPAHGLLRWHSVVGFACRTYIREILVPNQQRRILEVHFQA